MTLPPGYDQWKLAEPTDEEFDRDDDDRDGLAEMDGPDDPTEDRCVLGAACCCPHPFHGADECFDAGMAEALMAEEDPQGTAALRRALTRLLWTSVTDEVFCSCEENDRCPQCEAMAALGLEEWRGPRDAEKRLPRFT